MGIKPGTYLGGIRTVEDIRLRCRIDEETNCWLWSLRKDNGHAMIHYVAPDGVRMKRRGPNAVMHLLHGSTVPKGMVAYRRACCNEYSCCNPEHIAIGTRKEAGAAIRKAGRLKGLLTMKAAALRVARASKAKITMEQAEEIRSSEETHKALALKYGLSASRIGYIKRGEAWQPVAGRSHRSREQTFPAASVFAWIPARVRVTLRDETSEAYDRAARAGHRTFVGVPCAQGHTERYVKDRTCVACQKAKSQAAYQRYKEAA